MDTELSFAVFTKPWPHLGLADLARHVALLGFDAVELPVRPGFQVSPDRLDLLAEAVSVLSGEGLTISSLASEPTEALLDAAGNAGIGLVRIMVPVERGAYLRSEAEAAAKLEQIATLSERYGVKVGVQQHYGDMINSSIGLRSLLEKVRSPSIVAIWDAAHDGLAGLSPESGLDAVWDRLALVNLKNAYWERQEGAEHWAPHFTCGHSGQMSWPRVADELARRAYRGTICLTAEYNLAAEVDRFCRADLEYARSLLAGAWDRIGSSTPATGPDGGES